MNMERYCVFVFGTEESGKGEFLVENARYLLENKRRFYVINLDPFSELFNDYDCNINDFLHKEGNVKEFDNILYDVISIVCDEEWFDREVLGRDSSYIILNFPGALSLFYYNSFIKSIFSMFKRKKFMVCGLSLYNAAVINHPKDYFSLALQDIAAFPSICFPKVSALINTGSCSHKQMEMLTDVASIEPRDLINALSPLDLIQNISSSAVDLIKNSPFQPFYIISPITKMSLYLLNEEIDSKLNYAEVPNEDEFSVCECLKDTSSSTEEFEFYT